MSEVLHRSLVDRACDLIADLRIAHQGFVFHTIMKCDLNDRRVHLAIRAKIDLTKLARVGVCGPGVQSYSNTPFNACMSWLI